MTPSHLTRVENLKAFLSNVCGHCSGRLIHAVQSAEPNPLVRLRAGCNVVAIVAAQAAIAREFGDVDPDQCFTFEEIMDGMAEHIRDLANEIQDAMRKQRQEAMAGGSGSQSGQTPALNMGTIPAGRA